MMIDKSLAIGASRTTLRQLMDESGRLDLARRTNRRFNSRQDRSRALDEIQAELAPLALLLDRQPTIGYGGSLAYVLFSGNTVEAILKHAVISGTRGGAGLGHYPSPAQVTFSAHALARMNQRLVLMDLDGLYSLLHPVSELLMGLWWGATVHARGVRQLSVPFYGGALRCDVDRHALVVKTFVAEPSKREAQLVNDLRDTCDSFPESQVAEMWWAPLGAAYQHRGRRPTRGGRAVRAVADVALRFAEVIERYAWVEETHVDRHDPIGDVWKAARSQDRGFRAQ